MAEWEKYQAISEPHKNGDRVFGFSTGYAADLMAAGTPTVSSLYRTSITELISGVDIGDRLDVAFDGKFWWVASDAGRVGRLTWVGSMRGEGDARNGAVLWDIDEGTLEVQRVFVNEGRVVNLGGLVRPIA